MNNNGPPGNTARGPVRNRAVEITATLTTSYILKNEKKKKKMRRRRGRRTGPHKSAGANGGGQPSHRVSYYYCKVATLLKTLLFCDTHAAFLMHVLNMFAQHSIRTTRITDSLYFVLYVYLILVQSLLIFIFANV